ncbi:MAG: MBL fold metallo-hydrolase [Pseudomonadota bacterium]
MTRFSRTRRLLGATALLMSTAGLAQALEVHSYASQVNDVDSANSHWFETEDGVVLIDAQRLLPEAARLVRHIRATSDRDVAMIVVTHAHTDHYGGLPVLRDAFPDARIVTDETTARSIREDERGFIAMRNERHGDRFAPQAALTEAMRDAEIVADGETIEIGGETLTFTVLGPSEAESTLMVTVEAADTAFIGDLINVGAPAVPFESLANWLDHLDVIETSFDPDDRLYQGHGPAPVDVAAVAEQRRFLRTMDDLVRAAMADCTLTPAEEDEIVFRLERGWPFYQGVAGNTRQEVLGFAARRVADQISALGQ